MWKLLLALLVLGLGAWVISQQYPDIQRYLRMRDM